MVRSTLLTFLVILNFAIYGQNLIKGSNISVDTNSNFDYNIDLTNSSEASAIQFDITISKDLMNLESDPVLTQRSNMMSVSYNFVNNTTLRIIMFSVSGKTIPSGQGSILILKLKSLSTPGTYSTNFTNIVYASLQGKSESISSTSGSITINGGKLLLITQNVNFGDVILNSINNTQVISIKNEGVTSLNITGSSIIGPFYFLETFPITISPGNTTNLTLKINTNTKGIKTGEILFQSNDLDPLRGKQKCSIKGNIYAVNEIHLGSSNGKINQVITIPISINNMESFTGFQFDVDLPQGFSYVNNTVSLLRKSDHQASANLVNGKLRIIGFSPTNSLFSDNNGQIGSFQIQGNVKANSYSLLISNASISNTLGEDIKSNIFSGSVTILSPQVIASPSNINFGRVPITQSKNAVIRIENNGNSDLIINEIVKDTSVFSFSGILPETIKINSYKDFNLKFTPIELGYFNKDISFRNNTPEGQTLIKTSYQVFSPNYLLQNNQEFKLGSSEKIKISLQNNDDVYGIQTDILLPVGFTFDLNKIEAVDRAKGFSLTQSNISANTYRILMYSIDGNKISKGNGSILEIPISIPSNIKLSSYAIQFNNTVISNLTSKNISSEALENGFFNVLINTSLLDTDFDGIMDDKDKCPNTAKNEKVDGDGCPIILAAKEEENQNIYPNPFNNFIIINFDKNLGENININIYDVIGKLLFSKSNINQGQIIDCSSLTSGIYFLELNNSEFVNNSKWIKLIKE